MIASCEVENAGGRQFHVKPNSPNEYQFAEYRWERSLDSYQ